MSEKEEIKKTKDNLKKANLLIENIIESSSEKVNRLKFTPQEIWSLRFATNLISSYIEELEN
jgi:hypothetical protein